jgi:hypothetical protein
MLNSLKVSSAADAKAGSEVAKVASEGKLTGLKRLTAPSLKKLNQIRWSAGQAVTGLFRATRQ